MSIWDSALKGARSFLDKWKTKPVAPTATDAVTHDAFDEIVFNDMSTRSKALGKMIDDAQRDLGHGKALVRDTFDHLFQAEPQVREQGEMAPSHLANHAAQRALQLSPEFKETRGYTQHDEYSAAMATIGLASKVRDAVNEHRQRTEDAQEEADEAQDKAEEAAQALQQAAQATEDAQDVPGDVDQAALAAALQAALQAAQEAAQAAQAAQEAAIDTHAEAQAAMQAAADTALKEASEALGEEMAMFAAYGKSPGEVQRMDIDKRMELAARLHGNRMKEFRRLLGAMRMENRAQRRRKTVLGRDHVVGVKFGGLQNMIPTELLRLGTAIGKLQFLQRVNAEQVLNYDYAGTEKVGNGAVFCIYDGSGSMNASAEQVDYRDAACTVCGFKIEIDWNATPSMRCTRCGHTPMSREAWAKAITLALLDGCQASKRDFVAMEFSSYTQQMTTEFPRTKTPDIEALLNLTEHFFNGGTNYDVPLTKAMEIIERDFLQHGRSKADIVFVTDDECTVTRQTLDLVQSVKDRIGLRIWGIGLSPGINPERSVLSTFCDDVRTITDLTDTSKVADIFRSVA